MNEGFLGFIAACLMVITMSSCTMSSDIKTIQNAVSRIDGKVQTMELRGRK